MRLSKRPRERQREAQPDRHSSYTVYSIHARSAGNVPSTAFYSSRLSSIGLSPSGRTRHWSIASRLTRPRSAQVRDGCGDEVRLDGRAHDTRRKQASTRRAVYVPLGSAAILRTEVSRQIDLHAALKKTQLVRRHMAPVYSVHEVSDHASI